MRSLPFPSEEVYLLTNLLVLAFLAVGGVAYGSLISVLTRLRPRERPHPSGGSHVIELPQRNESAPRAA